MLSLRVYADTATPTRTFLSSVFARRAAAARYASQRSGRKRADGPCAGRVGILGGKHDVGMQTLNHLAQRDEARRFVERRPA